MPVLALQDVVEAPERVVRDVRRDAADPLDRLRLRLEEGAELGAAIAAPRQEADFRIEVVADLRIAAGDLPQVVGEVVERAAGVVAALRTGRASVGVSVRAMNAETRWFWSNLDVRVDAVGAVPVSSDRVVAEALAVDEDGAVARSADLTLHAHDAEVVRRADIARRRKSSISSAWMFSSADVPAADLAAQAARRRECRSAAPSATGRCGARKTDRSVAGCRTGTSRRSRGRTAASPGRTDRSASG